MVQSFYAFIQFSANKKGSLLKQKTLILTIPYEIYLLYRRVRTYVRRSNHAVPGLSWRRFVRSGSRHNTLMLHWSRGEIDRFPFLLSLLCVEQFDIDSLFPEIKVCVTDCLKTHLH